MFQSVGFIGLGLLGGSLAQQIKQTFPEIKIVGKARSKQTIDYALQNKIIDLAGDLPVLGQCDIVFIATPIENITDYVKKLYTLTKKETIIIDIGSTKATICKALKKYSDKFIGGHPMAGTEKTGIENSDPKILDKAKFVLTPYPKTKKTTLIDLAGFISALGMMPVITTPEAHDEAVAAISHAPYFNASALMLSADNKLKKQLAATGFGSCTRVAASDPNWGIDITQSNGAAISKQISKQIKELQNIQKMISKKQYKPLKKYLEKTQKTRKEMYL